MRIALLMLVACKSPVDIPTGPVSQSGTRVEVVRVNLSLWVDYIPLFGAYDSECRWLDPQIVDESTPWPPLQVFWVIYEDANDVDVSSFDDSYFPGDRVVPEDFAPIDGSPALGFELVTGFQTTMLPVQEIRRSPDDRTVEADFGSPLDATMRIEAFPEGDGCGTRTTYCTEDCVDFAPLQSIDIELGAFYSVQNVVFR